MLGHQKIVLKVSDKRKNLITNYFINIFFLFCTICLRFRYVSQTGSQNDKIVVVHLVVKFNIGIISRSIELDMEATERNFTAV